MNTENYFRLKYFFRIDVDSIRSDLMAQKKGSSSTDPSTLFPKLFSFLLKRTTAYHCFLTDPYRSASFFGEYLYASTDDDSAYIAGLKHLIFLSLMNHCIIKNWFFLRQSSSTVIKINSNSAANNRYYPEYKDQSELAQLYSNRYRNNYFASKSFTDAGDILSSSNKRALLHCDFYSHKLLNELSNSCNSASGNQDYFYTPSFWASFTYFLFNNRNVLNLNKSIINRSPSSRFFQHYSAFFADCKTHESSLDFPEDRFAFTYFCEKFYHPSAVRFLLQLFTDFDKTDALDTIACRNTLRILDGQIFSNICVHLLQSPYVFSGSFLFDCGLHMLTNTRLYPRYLTNTPGLEFTPRFSAEEKDSFIKENGLNLLTKYLHVLSEIVEPLLYDLWTVAIDIFYPTHEEQNDAINAYIKQHHSTITGEFCHFSTQDIISLVSSSGGKYHFNDTKLEQLCGDNKTKSEDFNNHSKKVMQKVFDIFSESITPPKNSTLYEKNYINTPSNNTDPSYQQLANQYQHIQYLHNLLSL